eukprot:8216200-Pyramimonas_sp.AAC.1
MYVFHAANEWINQTTEEALPNVGLATLAVHIDDLCIDVAARGFHDCVNGMYNRATYLAQL